jgi:large subunit ribosomal protein L29|tara:strand:- start:280 stop:483 length:204 start_codon:yes stop_codon:yes gene_type:complete
MKDTILTEMPINELNDLLLSEKERLAKLKMSHAVSPLENPLSIKYSRKKIARIMTELSSRKRLEKNK